LTIDHFLRGESVIDDEVEADTSSGVYWGSGQRSTDRDRPELPLLLIEPVRHVAI